jgi:MFS family permease
MANFTSSESPVTSDSGVPHGNNPGTSAELPPAKTGLAAALGDKTMRAPIFWSVVGRFPLYLITLALVVFTASRDSDYFSAGLLLGGYSLGAAVFAPFVARRADRYGQTPVLLITGVVCPLALISFVYAVSGSLATQMACVVVAGAATPPISGSIRSLWSAKKGMEQVGLSLETVLGNFFLIGGPLLLSIMLFWASPGAALIVGGLLSGAGAIGFATTRASRAHPATPSERDPLGALRSVGLIQVLIVLACAAIGAGIYNVALPAFAADHGNAGDVGLFFGAWGVGGILGGLWYGSRNFRWPAQLCFAVGMLVLTAGSVLPVFVWNNWSMGVILILLGAFEAPVTAISYDLINRTARATYVIEAFTWAITVSIAGAALGAQMGGLLISAYSTRAAFVASIVVMLIASAVAFAVRHRFAKPTEVSRVTPDPYPALSLLQKTEVAS